jgi:hypothetical protein
MWRLEKKSGEGEGGGDEAARQEESVLLLEKTRQRGVKEDLPASDEAGSAARVRGRRGRSGGRSGGGSGRTGGSGGTRSGGGGLRTSGGRGRAGGGGEGAVGGPVSDGGRGVVADVSVRVSDVGGDLETKERERGAQCFEGGVRGRTSTGKRGKEENAHRSSRCDIDSPAHATVSADTSERSDARGGIVGRTDDDGASVLFRKIENQLLKSLTPPRKSTRRRTV